MYYQVMIRPASGGFGMYEQGSANDAGEGWADKTDLVHEIAQHTPGACLLADSNLPEGLDDIRGSIYNQEGDIYGAIDRDGYAIYWAIVEA